MLKMCRIMLVLILLPLGAFCGDVQVEFLRCEYLVNPQGIDVIQPRLSWRMKPESGSLKPERGVNQVAYRILVASSKESLAEDEGDLWDSGKVKSDQSTQVVYKGKPLNSRQYCYWKVRIWGDRNNNSEWSKSANWTMGLLTPAAWKAKWISIDRAGKDLDSHDSPTLRKTFDIKKPVKSAQVSICGLGYYEMFLNGSKVGDHVLDPTLTSYNRNALYVTYDVSEALNKGKNAIGVQLANGVYNQEFRDAWNFQKAPWRAFPQMLLQMDIVYDDDTKERIVSDESWKVSTGPIYWDQLRMGVMYDARREQHGWSTAEFDDSKWQPAILREGVTGKLAAQVSEPIKVMETIEPKSILKKSDFYEVDFGENISGWTRLKVSGEAGTKITLDHGSHGLVHGKPLQTDVYTLKGNGEEVWEPGFTYHGFSKVKVSGFPGTPDKSNFDGRFVYSSFRNIGSFECSNPLLNKIVDLCLRSYKGNFVGIPTDCPHREKNGWTGDAQLAVELGLTFFGPEAVYSRWMDDMQAVQAEDGKLPCIVPDGGNGWGTAFLDGPSWESAYLIIPWYIYQYRGDERILAKHYESYKRWFSWYRDKTRHDTGNKRAYGGGSPFSKYKKGNLINQNNIIYYGIGDWPPNQKTPFEITSTAHYYKSAQIISRIAGLLGKKDEETEYAETASKVKKAFNREFYDKKTATYSRGSHTGMSTALYFGLVDDANRQRVADNLARDLESKGYAPNVGCIGARTLLRALADNGHLETAYKVINRKESPGWGHMVEMGRTTLAERLNGGGSNNHVFLGDVSAFMMKYFAGIRYDPENPGFQKFIIKPNVVGDLTWVKAHHDSPYGRIRSEWRIEDDKFLLEVTVPNNSKAAVFLPGEKKSHEAGPGLHKLEKDLRDLKRAM